MPQVHFAWDFNRFTENDGQFIDRLVERDAGVKVGLTTMHTYDMAGRPIAKSILRRVTGSDDEVGRPQLPKKPQKRLAGNLLWDAKLNDLPHQVAGAVAGIAKLNVFGLTVMATDNNQRTLLAAREERDRTYKSMVDAFDTKGGERSPPARPILFGVTHLSSSERDDFEPAVLRRAHSIANAGFDGIIVPGNLLRSIREEFPALITYVIAIRPEWSRNYLERDNQHRAISHLEALELGAEHICLGRPVSEHPRPLEAVRRIQEEMEQKSAA